MLAGPVAGYPDAAALAGALADPADPARGLGDVRYFQTEVEPHLDGSTVRWVGSVGGAAKAELLRSARAVLFPLRWDEPGGTAVVEALAAGVPVVAMRRGVLPELVEHGVTGWLAGDEDEFVGYLSRVDELSRPACREVAGGASRRRRWRPGTRRSTAGCSPSPAGSTSGCRACSPSTAPPAEGPRRLDRERRRRGCRSGTGGARHWASRRGG